MKHLPPKMAVIKVSKSANRYTLMKRTGKQQMYRDLKGKLFGNEDKGEFYRAVTNHLAGLVSEGWSFKFADTSANQDTTDYGSQVGATLNLG